MSVKFWFLLFDFCLFLFFIFHYLVRLWKFIIFLFCRWGLYFIFSNFSILLWFLTFYGLFGWFCRFNFFHRFLSFCRFALSFYCWRLFFFFDLLFLYFLTFHLNFVGFLLWVSISRFWPLSSWWRSFLYWLRRNNRFWFWFNLLHLNSFWLWFWLFCIFIFWFRSGLHHICRLNFFLIFISRFWNWLLLCRWTFTFRGWLFRRLLFFGCHEIKKTLLEVG